MATPKADVRGTSPIRGIQPIFSEEYVEGKEMSIYLGQTGKKICVCFRLHNS